MARTVPTFSLADLDAQPKLDVYSFSTDDAVELGLIAVGVIREWDLNLAVDIVLSGDLVFRAKLKDTGPDNDPWLAGKAAVALHYGEPSFLAKTRLIAAGTPFETLDFDHETMKAHGGAVPIRVNGDVVGTITMSGEPDAIDHEAAIEAITRFLAAR